MSELDIKEVHIVPVGSAGEIKDTDSKLDFYNSALVYLLNDKRSTRDLFWRNEGGSSQRGYRGTL